MVDNHNGLSFIEILIVLIVIGVIASIGVPSFVSLSQKESSLILKTQIIEALSMAKQKASVGHETIVFCLGNEHSCFQTPMTYALLYVDQFHDGILHNHTQLRAKIGLPAFKGNILSRHFPNYRKTFIFSANEWSLSDNGTIWYCSQKQTKPHWGISVNRLSMIKQLEKMNNGDIFDANGKVLTC